MAKNNHFDSNFHRLDSLLRKQVSATAATDAPDINVYEYARCVAEIENVIAVVSDIGKGTSRIFSGAFACALGLRDYTEENSIWETEILSLMSSHEQDEKVIAELRFYHFRHSLGEAGKRYYLMSKLNFCRKDGVNVSVLHRMYYVFEKGSDSVKYAICLYGPLSVDFRGKSVAVDSVTGESTELTSSSTNNIISVREREVLRLINSGLKSKEIADELNISIHTVNRHRQEIIAKLKVKNSVEACRIARAMELI